MTESALNVIAQACEVARTVQCDLQRVRHITKNDRSPVGVADFAAQAVIAMALRAAEPEALIVGEEHADDLRREDHAAIRRAVVDAVRIAHPGANEATVLEAIDACGHDATGGAFWALDPIDGTKGFLRGGQYAIALAYVQNGLVTFGVLGCPNLSPKRDASPSIPSDADHGVLVWAIPGTGAFHRPLRDQSAEPLRLRRGEARDPVRIARSVESAHSSPGRTQRVLDGLGRPHENVRLDSQCKYAVIARDQADAYLRMPTSATYREKIWDHAAGALIAAEAGLVVTDIAGASLDFSRGRRLENNRGICGGPPALHAQLIDAISSLGLHAPEPSAT